MFILITVILAILFICCIIYTHKSDSYYDCNDLMWWINFLVTVSLITFLCITLYYTYLVSTAYTINSEIEMYQEQNSKIEQDIKVIVDSYIKHENETLTSILPSKDSAEGYINMVLSFPELNSNELVRKQIDVYLNNANKIMELKKEEINISKAKWLLYFGH